MIISQFRLPFRAWHPLLLSLGILVIWDVLVTTLYLNDSTHFEGIDIQFTLFGSAIALFIGFTVNAAYGRWWEARTLWGQIVNSSRSVARMADTLIDHSPEGRSELATQIIQNQIAYVHVLRTALRGQPLPPEARACLGTARYDQIAAKANRQTAILVDSDHIVTMAHKQGLIGELARLQIEAAFVALTDAQGGLERIKNTPMPVQYRFLPRVSARVFAIILPFAVVSDLGWLTPVGSGLVGAMFLLAVSVGDQLADPFANNIYDVPMTAITRTIEIDLSQLIGTPTRRSIEPVNEILF